MKSDWLIAAGAAIAMLIGTQAVAAGSAAAATCAPAADATWLPGSSLRRNPNERCFLKKIGRAFRRLGRRISTGFRRAARVFRRVAQRIHQTAKKVGTAIRKGVRKGIQRAGQIARKVGQGIRKGLRKAGQIAKKVGQGIKTGLQKAGQAIAKVGGKIWSGIQKAFRAVTGGIVKIFLQLKGLVQCLARRSKMDIIKLFDSVVKSPFGFIKDTFTGALKFVGGAVSNVVTKGAESVAALVSAFNAGKKPDPKALHAFGDWVWGQFLALAGKVGALGCLLPFLTPVRNALRTAFGWVASTVLPLLGKLYKKYLEPKLTPLLAKALDAGVKLIVGQKWKDRLKSMAARIFSPAARAKEASKRLKVFLKMVKSGKGDLRRAWLDARAHISSAKDFGVRKLTLVAREAVKFLIEVLIDKLAPRVVDFGIKAVSTGVTLLNRVVDAACGLIPEVGAAICVFVTGAIRLLYTFVGSTALKAMIMKGIDWILKPVVNTVVNLVTTQIQKFVTGIVDKQVQRNKTVGHWATILQPLIDMVFKVITKWALPDAKSAGALNGLVAKLGDRVLELATGKKLPPPPGRAPGPTGRRR